MLTQKAAKRDCDRLFMAQFHGKPCEVCTSQGSTYTRGTCGHHIVPRSRSLFLRHDPMNIVVLCPTHHMFSNTLAAHSMNALAVGRFLDWLNAHKPVQLAYVRQHEWTPCPYVSWKRRLEDLRCQCDAS